MNAIPHGIHTLRSMLEREDDNIFDSLKRRRAIGTSKALRKDNLDSAHGIGSIPVALFQDLSVELRKA
jgi:hypothetical protein